MIDLQSEKICTFTQAANGIKRRIHPSTIARWASRGIGPAGRKVFLETLRLGGVRVASLEANQRFADRVTAVVSRANPPSIGIPGAQERTKDALERIGI